MRWTAKPLPEPEHKVKRTANRFAFWPTRVQGSEDETMVWLEFYDAYQEWYHNGYTGGWQTVARYAKEPV